MTLPVDLVRTQRIIALVELAPLDFGEIHYLLFTTYFFHYLLFDSARELLPATICPRYKFAVEFLPASFCMQALARELLPASFCMQALTRELLPASSARSSRAELAGKSSRANPKVDSE